MDLFGSNELLQVGKAQLMITNLKDKTGQRIPT